MSNTLKTKNVKKKNKKKMSKKYTWYWNYIQENNKGRQNKTKEKLYRRVLSARRRWSKNYNLPLKEIDSLIKESLGGYCRYCGEKITTENMALDHKTPQSRGGKDSISNVHIVCQPCNKKKGILTHKEYTKLWDVVFMWDDEAQKYINQSLSSQVWSQWN